MCITYLYVIFKFKYNILNRNIIFIYDFFDIFFHDIAEIHYII